MNLKKYILDALMGVKPAQAAQPTSQPVATPAPAPQPIPESVKPTGSKFSLNKVLSQIGVPLGAVIASQVNPNLTASMSGLATGYQGQMDRIRQAEQDRLEKLELLAAQEDAKKNKVIIKFKDGVTEEMTEEEARNKGYIK